MSAHLGDRLAALVDGELSHAERDRVLAHLTRCDECRAEVDAERQIKARLGNLSSVEPPNALLARLRDLPAPTGPRRGTGPLDAPRRPSTVGGKRRPGGSPRRLSREGLRRADARGASRLRRLAVGTGALVSIALGAAFAVGGGESSGTPVRPEIDQFNVEHASVSGTVPLVDPASIVGGGAP